MDRRKSVNIFAVITIVLVIVLYIGLFGMYNEIGNVKKMIKPAKPAIQTCMIVDSIEGVLPKLGCRQDRAHIYATALAQWCKYYRQDWKIVSAQITQESFWNPNAKSFVATQFKGDKAKEFAWGLFQIKPNTGMEIALELGDIKSKEQWDWKVLLDGPTSIRYGIYYFSKRVLAEGYDMERAVKAYNAGPAGLKMGKGSNTHYQRVKKFYSLICKEVGIGT